MGKRLAGWVLLGSGLLAGGGAHAQYAAPGFPMQAVRRPAAPPAPAREPDKADNPLLMRFWHEADPTRQATGRTKFFELVMARAKYPEAARPPQSQPTALMPTGRLFVVLLVRPDGSVRQPPRISRRELEHPAGAYPPAAVQALDAEARRVLGSLRFVRSRAPLDSLVVPMRFIAQ